MGFGKALDYYGSELFNGPLGVVNVGFEGNDLGLTTDQAELKPDLDIKDINYQQKGSKPYDHVITGADWKFTCTFGEIKTSLLVKLFPYLVGSSGSVGADSGHYKANIGKSLLDTVAGVLKIAATVDQVPSEAVADTMYFYLAIPTVNAGLIQWGVDVQRNLPVEFMIKPKIMAAGESMTFLGKPIHGYHGDPVAEDLPAAAWPDLEAPYPVSAVVNSATEVEVTLSENATEISGASSIEQMSVKVDNKFVIPTAVVYATNKITLTLPAASIAASQIVEFSAGEETWEDAAAPTTNKNQAVTDFPVTNDL